MIIPSELRWQNYLRCLRPSLPEVLSNTFSTTVAKVVGQVFFCSMAAYSPVFAFPGGLFLLILSVLMVPSQAYIIPRYLLMADLGWLNTLTALTVPGLFSSFGTFSCANSSCLSH